MTVKAIGNIGSSSPSPPRQPGKVQSRGLCRYKSGKCKNERAVKRNGQPHTLCHFHRLRQNAHQRKSDRKHRSTIAIAKRHATKMSRCPETVHLPIKDNHDAYSPPCRQPVSPPYPKLPSLREIVEIANVLPPAPSGTKPSLATPTYFNTNQMDHSYHNVEDVVYQYM